MMQPPTMGVVPGSMPVPVPGPGPAAGQVGPPGNGSAELFEWFLLDPLLPLALVWFLLSRHAAALVCHFLVQRSGEVKTI